MKKYRWGIISTANIGPRALIPALQASSIAEIAAVASRNVENAVEFAKRFAIPKAYGDYQALLEDDAIDVIYNPLPNHLHKEWSIKAAEAGKHVLCEKPLALDADEVYEMKVAADAYHVLLQEAFMYRHHPRIKAAVERVRSGKIGTVRVIEADFTYMLKDKRDIRNFPEMGGGAVMDVGCYCINIIRLMAAREPVSVQARAVWSDMGIDNQLVGILDFGDGLMAHFDCAFNIEFRQRCTIAGSEGYLDLLTPFNPGLSDTVIIENSGDASSVSHYFEGVDQYRLMVEDFMNGIEKGQVPFPVDDAIANMRVIEACLESARDDGRLVALN